VGESKYTHPAALDERELLKSCRVKRGRASGPGGQHRNKVETAVFIRHEPTGVEAQATESRQPERNRRNAVFRLRLRLALQHRVGVALTGYEPSERLRVRVRGGRLALNPEHDDAPGILAEALDVLAACRDDAARAAILLGLTRSQLIRLLKEFPPALADLNARRSARGLRPFR